MFLGDAHVGSVYAISPSLSMSFLYGLAAFSQARETPLLIAATLTTPTCVRNIQFRAPLLVTNGASGAMRWGRRAPVAWLLH